MRRSLARGDPTLTGWRVGRAPTTLAVLGLYCLAVPLLPPVHIGGVPIGPLDLLTPLSVALIVLNGRVNLSPAHLALSFYAAVIIVSCFWIEPSGAQASSFLRAVRFLEIITPFFLAATIRPPHDVLRRLYRWALMGMGVSVVAGIVLFLLQIPLGSQKVYRYPTGHVLFRAGGVFGDSSAYGHLTSTWLALGFLVLPLVLGRPRIRLIVYAAAMASIGVLALYGSLSRTALVA